MFDSAVRENNQSWKILINGIQFIRHPPVIGISLQQFPSMVDFKSMVRLNLVRYLLGIEHLTSGTKLITLKLFPFLSQKDVFGRLRNSLGIFGNDRVVFKNPSTPRIKISRLYFRKSWQVYLKLKETWKWYFAKIERHQNFFNFVVRNPCQSSSSLTILVPLWFMQSLHKPWTRMAKDEEDWHW